LFQQKPPLIVRNLDDKGGFCCDIALLFYGTALKNFWRC